jgi:hypothetical protein
MRFSSTCLLVALSNSVAHGFSVVDCNRARHLSNRVEQFSFSLNEASTDEYDEWYKDFDPGKRMRMNSKHMIPPRRFDQIVSDRFWRPISL